MKDAVSKGTTSGCVGNSFSPLHSILQQDEEERKKREEEEAKRKAEEGESEEGEEFDEDEV